MSDQLIRDGEWVAVVSHPARNVWHVSGGNSGTVRDRTYVAIPPRRFRTRTAAVAYASEVVRMCAAADARTTTGTVR